MKVKNPLASYYAGLDWHEYFAWSKVPVNREYTDWRWLERVWRRGWDIPDNSVIWYEYRPLEGGRPDSRKVCKDGTPWPRHVAADNQGSTT